jgi:hypothetical protein
VSSPLGSALGPPLFTQLFGTCHDGLDLVAGQARPLARSVSLVLEQQVEQGSAAGDARAVEKIRLPRACSI